MKKIAFYLNNPSMPNIDYSSVKDYNPGIAGSEYEFLLIPYLLQERNNGIEPWLLVNFKGVFPHQNVLYVSDLKEACKVCSEYKIDIFVVDIKYYNQSVIDNYPNLSFFVWAHNDLSRKMMNSFWKTDNVKKIIYCGREQMEMYRDHILTLKSTYAYNIFPFKPKDFYLSKIQNRDNHNVVYMGSIVPVKSFHILASAWKQVLKEVPDAHLYVIGSGQLYDRNAKLGEYGIAEAKYESKFMPGLTDNEGAILPSVHFMGLLGEEKYDVLGKCKVAVPNPTGNSECLPITVIEEQLMGCNITTIKHQAYLDTSFNKDYLFENQNDLSKYIVNRLYAPCDNYDDLYGYVFSMFGIEGNIQKWELIINNVDTPIVEPLSEHNYQNKTFKNFLFKVKTKFPLLNECLPLVKSLYSVWRR